MPESGRRATLPNLLLVLSSLLTLSLKKANGLSIKLHLVSGLEGLLCARQSRFIKTSIKNYQSKTIAKINGATIDASDSMMNFGVVASSLPQVIFSFGTAPEYEP